ncbi:unnamed protein product, partial [Mesorhabditis spiculigera]
MTVIGIAACFIYRHRQILTAGQWLRVSPWLWLIFLLFEYLLWVGGLSAVIYPAVFTQDLAGPRMQLLLRIYPNWRFLLDVPDLWLMDGSAKMAFLPFTSLFGFVFVAMLASANFVAGAGVLIVHSVYLLKHGLGHMSQATRQMHQKLIVNMFLQIGGTVLLMSMVAGVSFCFIYRHRQVLPVGHWASMTVLTQNKSGTSMQRILESHPNHRFLLEVPELWVLDSTVEYPFSPMAAFFSAATFMCTNVLTGGVCLIAHSFHLLNSRFDHMSAATRKMQKQLITNMLLQLCIPFMSLTFPWWIGGIIIGFDIEVPQVVVGIAFCFIYRHRQVLPLGHWARLPPWIWLLVVLIEYIFCTGFVCAVICMGSYTEDLTGSAMQRIVEEYPDWKFLQNLSNLWIIDRPPDFASFPVFGEYAYFVSIVATNIFIVMVFVPFLTLTIPWLMVGIMVAKKYAPPLALTQVIILINGCHAIFSSFQIVYLTKPYRQFVIMLFKPRR